MSKKQKKQKQNNKLFLPLMILGGVLLIGAAFYFANQGGADGGGTPSIAVDQQTIDYGDVKFDVEKTFAIKVTNTGDGTLRFKEEPYIEILEGC
jgi:flagellar basal body-associated protein FliL